MSTWSIIDTRRNIARRFGQSHLERAAPSLDAMAQRQLYARYHFQEVRRLLSDFQSIHLTDSSLFVVNYGQDEAAREAFETLMMQAGAHALACVLSIHAIADVTAFAVYQALGYGLLPGALQERYVSAKTLQAPLRATAGHEAIADLLSTLITDSAYRHVAALANRSKHQGLVRPLLNEDWTGERMDRHQLRFASFDHDSRRYPECELSSVLEPAYNLASTTTVDIGNRVNELLA